MNKYSNKVQLSFTVISVINAVFFTLMAYLRIEDILSDVCGKK